MELSILQILTNDDNENIEIKIDSVLIPEDRYILASLYFCIMIAGLFGNALVIIAVMMSNNLRSVTSAFIITLSLADFFTMLNVPWTIVAVLSQDGWPLPDWICISAAFMMITCIGVSISTMACIALNRLAVFTLSRDSYDKVFTPMKTAIIVFTAVFINAAVASGPVVFNFGKLGFDRQFSSCTWDKTHPMTQYYELFATTVQYPIPLFICITCYLKIYTIMRKQTKKILSKSDSSSSTNSSTFRKNINRRQWLVTKSMFIILCTFIICTLPFAIVMMVNSPGRFGPYSGSILLLNSALNPLIYAMKLPYFKHEMKCVLWCRYSDIGRRISITKS